MQPGLWCLLQGSETLCFILADEMNLPPDIPSYLSSQGTLSEPQEGYSNSEAGSHQQLMPPMSNGHVHKGAEGASPFTHSDVPVKEDCGAQGSFGWVCLW